MADTPSSETKDKTSGAPEPEVLKPQSNEASTAPSSAAPTGKMVIPKRSRHGSYRPSHKATFIGLAVVTAILLINGAVIYFVMRGQGVGGAQASREEVVLSSDNLDELGVRRNNVGDLGTKLTIGPDTRFNGVVTVAGDASIGGELKLNSKFSANDASLAKLQAGDTSLNTLNVNGDTTTSNLNLRRDLNVAGLTRLQGPVTISQILTVNNSLNVSGNLAVGGILSARTFQASSLVSDTTLTVGGHIITRGPSVSAGRGAALGATDTISVSGNDAAGTIAVNISANATRSGILANIAFRQNYGNTPRVVVTAVGPGASDVYITRSASGFSVGVSSISGGLSGRTVLFDYIVMQ
jgi:cytoskeletal protein CcmA (bactofilin family)